jgi:hypothetical protein
MSLSLRRHYPVRFERSVDSSQTASHPLSPVHPSSRVNRERSYYTRTEAPGRSSRSPIIDQRGPRIRALGLKENPGGVFDESFFFLEAPFYFDDRSTIVLVEP